MTTPFIDPEYDNLLAQLEAEAPVTAMGEAEGAVEGMEEAEAGQASNEAVQPNSIEEATGMAIPEDEASRALAQALYGSDFPLTQGNDAETPSAWASWVRGRWSERREAVTQHLHAVERNRLFRAGQQWVSATGLGPWREPVRPSETSRVVANVIGPALDARLQVVTEQRPGFSVSPMTLDPDDQRKAEARQAALDYQFEQQQMDRVRREAAYWAQTDGVSFLHTFWDDQAGPWDERMGEGNGQKKPLGDLRTQVLRVEQVRVSANASATQDPYLVIVREVIPAVEAAQRYGPTGAIASGSGDIAMSTGQDTMGDGGSMSSWVLQQSNPGEADRLRNADVVERFTVYMDKHPDLLPDGLQMVVVGESVVVGPMPLLFGTIPIAPCRDGTTDPSYYPRPVMEQWVGNQQRINALRSAWTDSVRLNKGGRLLARPGSITKETYLGGLTNIVEVTGAANLNDAVIPMPSFSVAADLKELLQIEVKEFEDKSGWNDSTRGQFSSGESGRAIIAQREQMERVFAPAVQAMAQALTQWGKVQLAGMAWGYDVPRDLGAVGKARPDLARALKSDDFDGSADVKVEPETLMPMPKAMRLFMLDEMFAKRDGQGQPLITSRDYRRMAPFAMIKDIQSPDADQEARANRVADAILTRNPVVPPIRWQDNESIHQDVLERKILLQDDVDPDVIQAADARWMALAQQAAQKQGGAPPAPMPPSGGAPGANGGNSPFAPSPATQPLASAMPGIAAAPAGGLQDTALFEASQPQ